MDVRFRTISGAWYRASDILNVDRTSKQWASRKPLLQADPVRTLDEILANRYAALACRR